MQKKPGLRRDFDPEASFSLPEEDELGIFSVVAGMAEPVYSKWEWMSMNLKNMRFVSNQ